ncbi:hypothetical protein ColTof4_14470 [Colletotrichum tofieldiae]|nr:hypothetical protein ColTof4_14470 [Colletotrichum tofieldiae]
MNAKRLLGFGFGLHHFDQCREPYIDSSADRYSQGMVASCSSVSLSSKIHESKLMSVAPYSFELVNHVRDLPIAVHPDYALNKSDRMLETLVEPDV